MGLKRLVSVMISPEEVEVLGKYTRIPSFFLKRMLEAIDAAKQKRVHVKRVRVTYLIEELDKIIACLAEETNKQINSEGTQYILDSLFGRLAEKYNYHRCFKI